MTNQPSLEDLRIDRSAPSPRKRWPWVLVLLILAFGAGAWWFFQRPQTTEVETVTVQRVEAGTPQASVLDASGYVTPRRRATVSSKTTARIDEVLIEEGDVVKQGQVLARLDSVRESRQLALSRQELATSEAQQREVAVRLQEAQVRLARVEKLAAAGVETQDALDTASAAVDSLIAQRATADEQVTLAQRRIELRRQELEDTIIRAPFDGVVVTKDAQPGEMISPVSAGGGFTRTGICTVVDMSSLEIEVDVNEAYIDRVESEQRVSANLDAYPDWDIPASVITSVPTADRQKATVKVRIAFDQLDPRILPDMGVKVSFLDADPEPAADSGTAESVILLSRRAITRIDGKDAIWVVRDGAAEQRFVTLGRERGALMEITSGAAPGERAIADPPQGLSNGAAVTTSP
ncbi:MAG: efflux RND transporter periplasmic adaptor subunit [Acidobacteriota bacterium]